MRIQILIIYNIKSVLLRDEYVSIVLEIKTNTEDTLKTALDQRIVTYYWYLLPKGWLPKNYRSTEKSLAEGGK